MLSFSFSYLFLVRSVNLSLVISVIVNLIPLLVFFRNVGLQQMIFIIFAVKMQNLSDYYCFFDFV